MGVRERLQKKAFYRWYIEFAWNFIKNKKIKIKRKWIDDIEKKELNWWKKEIDRYKGKISIIKIKRFK